MWRTPRSASEEEDGVNDLQQINDGWKKKTSSKTSGVDSLTISCLASPTILVSKVPGWYRLHMWWQFCTSFQSYSWRCSVQISSPHSGLVKGKTICGSCRWSSTAWRVRLPEWSRHPQSDLEVATSNAAEDYWPIWTCWCFVLIVSKQMKTTTIIDGQTNKLSSS